MGWKKANTACGSLRTMAKTAWTEGLNLLLGKNLTPDRGERHPLPASSTRESIPRCKARCCSCRSQGPSLSKFVSLELGFMAVFFQIADGKYNCDLVSLFRWCVLRISFSDARFLKEVYMHLVFA